MSAAIGDEIRSYLGDVGLTEYMGFREDTEALNYMTIQAVGGLLGLRLPSRGTVHCPFPDHDDRTPSFEVKSSGNRWFCYGCNRHGGAIDFVKTYHGTGFLEAKRWLADRAGMGTTALLPRGRPAQLAPVAAPSPPPMDEVVESPPDYEVYEALLQCAPLQASGLKYLIERGLSEETISAFRIGQLSDCRVVLDTLIGAFSYQRIETAGLLTNKSTARNSLFLFPEESLLFPFLEDDQIAYLQVRLISESADQGKWRNLNHRRRRIYNVDAMLETQRKLFAVCEGVIDTLSATELGYSAIGLIGVNARLKKEQISRLRGKQIDILLDWDLPGERGAAELHKEMRSFGIASTRKKRPSPTAKDVNDYLMELRERA